MAVSLFHCSTGRSSILNQGSGTAVLHGPFVRSQCDPIRDVICRSSVYILGPLVPASPLHAGLHGIRNDLLPQSMYIDLHELISPLGS